MNQSEHQPVVPFPALGFPPGLTQPAPPQQTPPGKPVVAGLASDASQWCELLGELAASPTRRDALEHLLRALQEGNPDSPIRIATGKQRPRWLWDPKLGRLGRESSLVRELAAVWSQCCQRPGEIVCQASDWYLALPLPEGTPPIVVWGRAPAVSGQNAASARRFVPTTTPPIAVQLCRHARPLAAVIACRPRVASQHWAGLLKRRVWLTYGAIATACVLVGLLPVPYRISCRATVEPTQQRVIAAPFDAVLSDCHVRPGDRVQRAQVLLTLDGRPLQAEMDALLAEHAQSQKRQSVAMASGKIADAQLAELHCQQLNHKIELLRQRLEHVEIRSPIDGVVLSGDLHRAVGTPVETGKPLLEVSPLEQMLVELAVPEADVNYVAAGLPTSMRLHALPGVNFCGFVDLLEPSAAIRDGENVFVAHWTLPNTDDALRPGMQGYATIKGPPRPLVWKWIRQGWDAALRAVGW